MKIKTLLDNNIGELKLNETYYLFIEKLDYDNVLSVELCTYELGDMVCNGLELLQHNLTPNNSITQLQEYGHALIRAYEQENGL